jgi:thioesterase domain-containing protein/acyl carrier protein
MALGRGYLARPGLTAERFVPDPRGTAGERLYRSGDLARFRPDGQLEFLGRIDHQVKVRGFRVELGEIEAALGAHPSVRQSVAVVRRDGRGEASLLAYVVCRDPVPAPSAALDAGELSRHLRTRLPDSMVPAAIVLLDTLPLTAQGKVDRRALPAPDRAASATGAAGPRDELELALVELWQEVLDRQPIGVGDDFFALGGHSLLAVQLMLRLEQKLGVALPLSALFEGPTVEAQAALLRRSGVHRREVVVGIRPAGGAPPFFCVHPVGGNVLCYVDLARRLGPEQPFYGLQTPDPPAVGETVEEMAASYLEALGRVDARGPYRLGGWSMGGLVAYEMARRLTAEGREVATLVLIDAAVPLPEAPELPAGGELVALFAGDLAGLAGAAPAAVGEGFAMLETDEALRRLLAVAESLGAVPPGIELAQVRQLFEVFARNLRATRRYRPRPWDGRLTLLRTAGAGPQDLGWGALAAGGVAVHEIPGDHYTMLREPQVAALAVELARCLDRQPEP